MDGGDISADMAPRLVFVWENLLANLDPGDEKREARWVRYKRWDKALSLWDDNVMMRHVLLDTLWRKHRPVDLLCTHAEGFASRLKDRLEATNYPYSKLYSFPALEYAALMSFLPHVQMVFYSDPMNPFTFGSKGVQVQTAGDVQRML